MLESGGGHTVVVDGGQMPRPCSGPSRLTAQQFRYRRQAGLVPVLDNAVRLFRFRRSSRGGFDALRGCLEVQVRFAYFQLNRRIGVLPERLGTRYGKARLLLPGFGLTPVPQSPAQRNSG